MIRLVDRRLLQPLDGRADQQAVRGGQVDLPWRRAWCMTSAAPQIEPAVLIMSSKIRATLPSTSLADHVGLAASVRRCCGACR